MLSEGLTWINCFRSLDAFRIFFSCILAVVALFDFPRHATVLFEMLVAQKAKRSSLRTLPVVMIILLQILLERLLTNAGMINIHSHFSPFPMMIMLAVAGIKLARNAVENQPNIPALVTVPADRHAIHLMPHKTACSFRLD